MKVKVGVSPHKAAFEQLRYLYGNLASYQSGYDEKNAFVRVDNVDIEGEWMTVSFFSSIVTSWPKEIVVPNTIKTYLPHQMDSETLATTMSVYAETCLYKINRNSVTWFAYLRPFLRDCTIRSDVESGFEEVTMHLSMLSTEEGSTSPKFLNRPWGGIIVFHKDNASNENDISIMEFNNFTSYIEKHFSSSKEETSSDGLIKRTYFINDAIQPVQLNVYLFDNIHKVLGETLSRLQEELKVSNFFSYSGHAGMGAVMEYIDKNVSPHVGNESLIFINSCHSLGYSDRIKSKGHYYLLNATLNYFGTFARTNEILFTGLIARRPLEKILDDFPKVQRTLLITDD